MIASDIHGSAKYCRLLIEACDREGVDRLLLLGDILYHGPRNDLPEEYSPKEVAGMLNARKDEIYCVRGNCEAEVDQMMLKFPVCADYILMAVGNRMMFVTHGHIYNLEKLPPMKRGDILLYGHTHVPAFEEFDGFAYFNPGSVALPKENTVRGYILLDGCEFVWKTLEGKEYMRYKA
jgi:hypothetical protein